MLQHMSENTTTTIMQTLGFYVVSYFHFYVIFRCSEIVIYGHTSKNANKFLISLMKTVICKCMFWNFVSVSYLKVYFLWYGFQSGIVFQNVTKKYYGIIVTKVLPILTNSRISFTLFMKYQTEFWIGLRKS